MSKFGQREPKWSKSPQALCKEHPNTVAQSNQFDQEWANRGEELREKGQYTRAIAAFDKALELDSGNDWIWAHRGEALRQAGRFEEAIASFQRAIEIDP